ncbi:hypothetical protein [uncultured Hyphomicrobium sp.]|uniref:hypothetical protein n=1 Tax=uncultured Hyphomicrobium sp. TaxID=194373 RepID=UPI0025DD36CA|nr:hypothetical protein [uncultured Hyphomicrobium sp.]
MIIRLAAADYFSASGAPPSRPQQCRRQREGAKMEDVSRRHFICGTAFLALLPAASAGDWGVLSARPLGIDDLDVRCALDRLSECLARFRVIENADIPNLASLHEWQFRYDDLVGAADAVRETITDDTPGREDAIAFARACVPPSCERAYAYWLPMINGMSKPYARAGSRFFEARKRQAMSYATGFLVFEDHCRHLGDVVEAVGALRDTLPVTDTDRRVLRRVIESLNNDDIVNVAIARNTLAPWEVGNDFAAWARPCGNFTCISCREWLSMELAG